MLLQCGGLCHNLLCCPPPGLSTNPTHLEMGAAVGLRPPATTPVRTVGWGRKGEGGRVAAEPGGLCQPEPLLQPWPRSAEMRAASTLQR